MAKKSNTQNPRPRVSKPSTTSTVKPNKATTAVSKIKSMSLDEFLAAEPEMMDDDDFEDSQYPSDTMMLSDPYDDESDHSDQDYADRAPESSDDDQAAQHKLELQQLKHTQPEFYKFLLENDQSLLEFDDENHRVEEELDDEETEFIQHQDSACKIQLDRTLLLQWESDLASKVTSNNIRPLVVAFRSAVQDSADSKSVGYVIDSPSVQSKLIALAFKHVPQFLTQVLGDSQVSPQSTPKWKRVSPMTKVFLTNALKLFKDTNDAGMVEYLLQELHSLVPYMLPFTKLTKDYFRLLLSTWGSQTSDSLRVIAFACLRDLADKHPQKFLEPALKGCYMMFVKSSRRTTVHTLPTITLMTRCVVEMYGLDADMAYQISFIYVRQLAIHLRNAMSTKSKEAYRQVYQWPYVHSLRLWSHILLTYAPAGSAHPLSGLVYPIVQTMLGVVRLVPTVHYHPLHLHILGSITEIVKVCRVYVPLSSYLIVIMEAIPVETKMKKSTLKPLYLPVYLKCPKQYTNTRVYMQSIRSQVHLCLLRYLVGIGDQVAFPELSTPVVLALKTQQKTTKDAAWGKIVKNMLEKIDAQCRYMRQLRQNSDIAPTDLAAIEKVQAHVDIASTPLGQYGAVVERIESKRMEAVQESFVQAYDSKGPKSHQNYVGDVSEDGSDDSEHSDGSVESTSQKIATHQPRNPDENMEEDFMAELKGVGMIMDDDSE